MMIKQLLSLSSQINNSSSCRDDVSSQPSRTSSSTKHILSLQQLIQVNESLLDSVLLTQKSDVPNNNEKYISSSTENDIKKSEGGVVRNITIDDVRSVLTPPYTNNSNIIVAMTKDDTNNERCNMMDDDEYKRQLIQRILLSTPGFSIHNEEEIKIFQSILSSQTNNNDVSEEQILMVVQYILRLSSIENSTTRTTAESIIFNIMNITYPLLLATPHYSTLLRDAIMNATIFQNNSSGNEIKSSATRFTSPQTKQIIQPCLELIQKSISTILDITIQDARKMKFVTSLKISLPEWITTVIEFSCRFLARILDLVKKEIKIEQKHNSESGSSWKDCIENIFDSIHDSAIDIMTALCYYGGSTGRGPLLMNGRTSSLLRIVTSLLLPSLLENGGDVNKERMLSLWNFIYCLIREDDENAGKKGLKKCRTWKNSAPSVASGILCIIAPNLSSLSLPLLEENQDNMRLLQHPTFWRFIKNALNSESAISVDSRGMKGGGTFFLRAGGGGAGSSGDEAHVSGGSSTNPYLDDDNGMEDENVGQLVRRRSIHILHSLIAKEFDELKYSKGSSQAIDHQHLQEMKTRITVWKKYILCFEALEMEEEAHLVDQVWDTVTELCAACCNVSDRKGDELNENAMDLPPMSWDMVGSLFARVLLSDSPTLRKLGLFKLLTGRAGIALNDIIKANNQKKGKKKGKKGKKKGKPEPSPISTISPSFVLLTLIPSFDSLSGPGFNFVNEEGVTTNHDLSLLLGPFVTIYCRSLMKTPERLNEFVNMILSSGFVNSVRVKTLVLVYKAVTEIWNKSQIFNESTKCTLFNETISETAQSFYRLFHTGSVVFDYQQGLLLNFAKILSNSVQPNYSTKPTPLKILETLILYVSIDENTKITEEESKSAHYLQEWVINSFGEEWITTVCASCAASFVSGELVTFESDGEVSEEKLVLSTLREREVGASISKLCTLVGSFGKNSASSMLWPAINKGLMYISTDADVDKCTPTTFSRKATRALILLESGCKERVLNGIGHGDLLVDKQGKMVPPPPNIEVLLSRAISYLLSQLNRISICDIEANGDKSQTRSGSYLPNQFALIINQLNCLKKAYPSSVMATTLVAKLLSESLQFCKSSPDCINDANSSGTAVVKEICLLYGSLVFADESLLGAISKENDLHQCCSNLLGMTSSFMDNSFGNLQGWQVKAMKSIFQHAKWGSLSLLLPVALKSDASSSSFYDIVIDTALDSVHATPAKGLSALFGCAVTAAKHSFDQKKDKDNVKTYTKNMKRVIDALFTIMDDTEHSATRAYMLQSICSLLFSPERLAEEYHIFKICRDEEGLPLQDIVLPIRSAFRKLITIAGTHKPYISKYAISYISAAWLNNGNGVGLSAIPYREDIAKLLIHKEAKLDEASSHKEGLVQDDDLKEEGGFSILPMGTPDTSVARGFLLSFLDTLPDVGDGLEQDVKTKICYYLSLWLLDEVCLSTQESGAAMVAGALHYCQVLRAWQSLCLLSRFVTSDIAELISQRIFKAMSSNLPGQIRYFIEIYTIQVTRRHPVIFGKELINQIKRVDITQQYVCSMMIVAGNLIVGKYANDFIHSSHLEDFEVKEILAAVIPWLGSTLSFCRAIAQLLIHKLVPFVFPSIANDGVVHPNHMDFFFVKNTWEFLDKNSEMRKLRQKQLRFFESYEADSICTPEGIFGFPVDGVDESNPPYLIDALKKCLIDIGNENAAEAPEWKQMEQLLQDMSINDEEDDNDISSDTELVNFQRKILPIDTLNLTLETYKKQKRQNAAGRNRQSLIVCASLIDKVTNLGGITRTAEIFAAEKVIVPDAKVRKMDNFKTISVGAGEWIEIEELKEDGLLQWLKQCKRDGYKIVGVEQTSSSKCLSHVKFEGKSVLLLGKEKEGIPQEFLNVVDQCVEIPQLGVIRSLNVHVSAAICMWEYTKQMMTQ